MKKQITLLLAIAALLTMTACRRNKPNDTATDGAGNTTGTTQNLQGTMEENVNKIIEANSVGFMGGLIPLDLQDTTEDGLWAVKSYTGLDSAEQITDAAIYEPMTGSQAFSLVMVRVKNAADAKNIAQQMKDNIDPGKWICVRADEMLAAGYGDTVMFIMLDSQLGKSAQSYVDTFANLCGGKVDFTI